MAYIPPIIEIYNYRNLGDIEYEFLTLVNEARNECNVLPVAWNESLRKIARYKSNEMLQYEYFAHKSIYTGHPYELAKNYFNYIYKFYGENIQMGIGYKDSSVTAKYLFEGWMKSRDHRANILSKNYGKMGVGIAYSDNSKIFYTSQMFSD